MSKKNILIVTIGVVVVAIVVVISILAFPHDESEQLTVLSLSEGDVLIMKAGNDDWEEGQTGQQLDEEDIIKIGESSRASITFFDGSIIELEAGTQVQINTLEPADGGNANYISIDQDIGRSISRIKKLADPASNYEIETPSGVAVVRGTTMVVYVDAQGISKVISEEGSVSVQAQGIEVVLTQGMQSMVLPGQPPSEPSLPGGEGTGSIEITRYTLSEEETPATYIFEVTNVGNTPQSNVFVFDNEIDDITYMSGDINNDTILDPGETWLFIGTESTP